MNRGQHPGTGTPRAAGLQALNTANADAQLDDILHQYFRLALPPSVASKKRLKRPRHAGETLPNEETTMAPTPEAALKRIKNFLKASEDAKHIQRVLDAITNQLSRAKSQAKLLPLIVRLTTELFARSAAFRALIATQAAAFYTKLLEAAGEKYVVTRRHRPRGSGPKATQQSESLHTVLAMVEAWREDFGARYPTIVAGHAWLVEMGYEFPRVKETQDHAARDNAERVRHQISVRQLQVQKMEREMAASVPEMETTLVEMESIFEILVPTLEAFELEEKKTTDDEKEQKRTGSGGQEALEEEDDDDAVEWEDVHTVSGEAARSRSNGGNQSTVSGGDPEGGDADDEAVEWEDVEDRDSHADEDEDDADGQDVPDDMDINDIVQAYGLGSSSYQLMISIPTTLCEQSAENEVLFRSLADGVLQIRKRFLPLVSDWLQIADGDAVALEQPRDAALLRRLHDLRSRLESVTLKWEDLVEENERKQFARIRPRVVTLPLATFDGPVANSSSSARQRPSRRQKLL